MRREEREREVETEGTESEVNKERGERRERERDVVRDAGSTVTRYGEMTENNREMTERGGTK